jgi:hypothetical protein
MDLTLTRLIVVAGVGQLGVLIASALVPFQLRWREELQPLSRLHRQMYWVYGGYVVLSIIAFALLSIVNAGELASGGGLARGFCAYVAVFWGVRLALQAVFDGERTSDGLVAEGRIRGAHDAVRGIDQHLRLGGAALAIVNSFVIFVSARKRAFVVDRCRRQMPAYHE